MKKIFVLMFLCVSYSFAQFGSGLGFSSTQTIRDTTTIHDTVATFQPNLITNSTFTTGIENWVLYEANTAVDSVTWDGSGRMKIIVSATPRYVYSNLFTTVAGGTYVFMADVTSPKDYTYFKAETSVGGALSNCGYMANASDGIQGVAFVPTTTSTRIFIAVGGGGTRYIDNAYCYRVK